MEYYRLQALTESEKKFAEKNHNLIYAFLYEYKYSIEEYYSVAVFGYLKGVQIYHQRKDLRKRYDFYYIAWQYMRSEVGNYHRKENAKKRKPIEAILSLDAECSEMESLYNCTGGKSAEAEVMELEIVIELVKSLSDVQRKITNLKMTGYSNKETYLILEIKPSTYYKEIHRIKSQLENLMM